MLEHAKIPDAAHEGGGFIEERVHFYNLLYDADANPLLVELFEHLRRSVGPALLGLRVGRHDMSHVELAEEVAAGGADAAIGVLVPHLREVCEALVLLVRDQAGD